MCRFRRISQVLSVAAPLAAFFGVVIAVNPVMAAAAPDSVLIQQAAGSTIFDNGTGFMWGTTGSSFAIARTQNNGKTWSKDDLDGVSDKPGRPCNSVRRPSHHCLRALRRSRPWLGCLVHRGFGFPYREHHGRRGKLAGRAVAADRRRVRPRYLPRAWPRLPPGGNAGGNDAHHDGDDSHGRQRRHVDSQRALPRRWCARLDVPQRDRRLPFGRLPLRGEHPFLPNDGRRQKLEECRSSPSARCHDRRGLGHIPRASPFFRARNN